MEKKEEKTIDKYILKVKKLSKNATIPTLGSKRAAGYDLYAPYDYTLAAKSRYKINTDISIQTPSGYYGRVFLY